MINQFIVSFLFIIIIGASGQTDNRQIVRTYGNRNWIIFEEPWINKLKDIYENFSKKFGGSNLIEKDFYMFEVRVDECLAEIRLARKEKRLSQLNMLEMQRKKPNFSEARKIEDAIKVT